MGLVGCSSPHRPWTATELGTGRCVAINEDGTILGLDEQNATFTSNSAGERTPLGTFEPDALAVGVAIDSDGQVVGYSESASGRKAIRYRGGAWSVIEGLGPWSAAISVSSNGAIVGVTGTDSMSTQAFRLAGDDLTALPLPTDRSTAGYVAGIQGRVAGIEETAAGDTQAFLIEDGELRPLGTLGGRLSAPLATNFAGDLVGAAQTASGATHPFHLPAGTSTLIDLGLPDGATGGEARGIDRRGRVVTNAVYPGGMTRPFFHEPGQPPRDLLPTDAAGRPWVSAHAAAMAPDGRIVGWGTPKGGTVSCVLWSPEL